MDTVTRSTGVSSFPSTRSFKPRRRSLTAARARAYSAAWDRWGVAVDGPQLSLAELFGTHGIFVLDIGFGTGDALLDVARARPAEQTIGVEVHTPGLAAVLEAVVAEGLANVRVVDGDVLDFLGRLPHGSLDEVRIWFPDPWPKQRQQHRRLVRPEVVAELVDRLHVGGALRLATDVSDYAGRMQHVCAGEPRLTGGVVPRPSWRPLTRFETRGAAAGHTIVDMLYTVGEC
ncbi:MAG: tRNA (guanosine(46)-N7)-methyltransferase TrmB [Ilumatobacteraceae bacterium]